MTLIERLEAAGEGSRELDFAIADAVLGPVKPPYVRGRCEKYSTSLDAAMTLVSEGSIWMVTNTGTANPHEPEFGRATAIVGKWNAAMSDPVEAATPALALCIASLKARGVS